MRTLPTPTVLDGMPIRLAAEIERHIQDVDGVLYLGNTTSGIPGIAFKESAKSEILGLNISDPNGMIHVDLNSKLESELYDLSGSWKPDEYDTSEWNIAVIHGTA